MKKIIATILLSLLIPLSVNAAYTWSQGGTNSSGPYSSSTTIISDGVKFLGVSFQTLANYLTSFLNYWSDNGTNLTPVTSTRGLIINGTSTLATTTIVDLTVTGNSVGTEPLYVSASSTIARRNQANTFSGTQAFTGLINGTDATFSGNVTTSNLSIDMINGILEAVNGHIQPATAGVDYISTSSQVWHNQLLGLQGGLSPNYYHSDQPINTTSSVVFQGVSTTNATTSYGFTNYYQDFNGLTTQPASPPVGDSRIHGFVTQGFTRLEEDNECPINNIFLRDNYFIARNVTGSTLAANVAVYSTSSTGGVPNVALAKANSTSTLPALGLTEGTINNNAYGCIMKLGILNNINTSAFNAGDQLYVSTTAAGQFTNVRPSYPNIVQRVGSVLASGVGNGSMLVTIAPFLGGLESGTTQPLYTFGGGFITNSSSTFVDGVSMNNLTSTQATTTKLYVSNSAVLGTTTATNLSVTNLSTSTFSGPLSIGTTALHNDTLTVIDSGATTDKSLCAYNGSETKLCLSSLGGINWQRNTGTGVNLSIAADAQQPSSGAGITFSTGGTERMRILGGRQADHTTDGFIGIGTSTPSSKLEVLDTSSAGIRGIVSTQISSDANSAQINLHKARGSVGSLSAVNANDILGSFQFKGWDGTNNTFQLGAAARGTANQTWTNTAHGTFFSILTTPDNSVTTAEALRVTGSGLVGIATTTPVQTLQVNGTIGIGSGGGIVWPAFSRNSADGGLLVSKSNTAGALTTLLTVGASGNISVPSGGSLGVATSTVTANTIKVNTGSSMISSILSPTQLCFTRSLDGACAFILNENDTTKTNTINAAGGGTGVPRIVLQGNSATNFVMMQGGAAGVGLVGIGFNSATTSPAAVLSVAGQGGGGAGSDVPLFMISSSTSAYATNTVMYVNNNGVSNFYSNIIINSTYGISGSLPIRPETAHLPTSTPAFQIDGSGFMYYALANNNTCGLYQISMPSTYNYSFPLSMKLTYKTATSTGSVGWNVYVENVTDGTVMETPNFGSVNAATTTVVTAGVATTTTLALSNAGSLTNNSLAIFKVCRDNSGTASRADLAGINLYW